MADAGWFIYAMGSGWGHLNRALALARVAVRARPVQLLTNSPYIEQLHSVLSIPNLTLHSLHHLDALAVARQAVQSLLSDNDYDTLIIDTFPRGLVGELADIIPHRADICRVLIHRDLTPDYIRAKAIEPFVSSHYDGVLLPGESAVPLAHLPQAKLTAPWLSRSDMELPNADKLRSHWNIPFHAPLIVVCATGQPEEREFFSQVCERIATAFPAVTVRCLSATCPPGCDPSLWLSHWPGIEALQLADVVVGSGGYNLVHECSALGIPLIAFAQKRRYDRQALRIREYAQGVETMGDAIILLKSLLQGTSASSGTKPCYRNGVRTAIEHIENWRSHKNSYLI